MLMPFEWAVITVEEARLLMEYIEKSTSSKMVPRRYEKIQEVGLYPIYEKLREFVAVNAQYQELQNLDVGSILTGD